MAAVDYSASLRSERDTLDAVGMQRSLRPEIMDDPSIPEFSARLFYRELSLMHRVLGNRGEIIARLRRNPEPLRRVIDIGCGTGALLAEIRRRLGAEVTGIDLRPLRNAAEGVPIIEADATRHPLPEADVAVAVCVIHHLSESELIALIRNVGRSCRRFIVLDLVRHPLPMALFTIFVGPFVHRVTAADGRQSIRRAFTPCELRALVERALAGTPARFEHSVSPIFARQIVDITY